MKKNGFTLVELLAVIGILAVLVIIALPNVLGMFNKAKKNNFTNEVRTIYTTARTQFVSDTMHNGSDVNGINYGRDNGKSLAGDNFYGLDLSGTTKIDYLIHFNLDGKVTSYYVTDGEFQFSYEGPDLKIEEIEDEKIASTIGMDEDNLIDIRENTAYVGDKPYDLEKLCIVNAKSYGATKEYYYFKKGESVSSWTNSSNNTRKYTIAGLVDVNNEYTATDGSGALVNSNTGCYYPKMTTACALSGYAKETVSGDTMYRVKTTFDMPQGMSVTGYDSSMFKTSNIRYNQFILKTGLFTTESADSNKMLDSSRGCYFNADIQTTGTPVSVSIRNQSWITCYSNQTVGQCLQNTSIGGLTTYYGSKGVGYGHNYYVNPMLLVEPDQKYFTSYGLVCLDGESEVEVYDKKKKKKVKKKLKDVTYDDLILCWDFDLGKYTYQKPVWIMKEKRVQESLVLTFSDGSKLKVAGGSGDHRIFNLDTQMFTSCKSDNDTPIGMRTINSKDEIITLVKKERVQEEMTICNVVTYKDINIYANGILTSRGSNNLYKINDMKFVKDDRETLSREDVPEISNDMYYGLRIGERDIKVYGSKENAIKELTAFVKDLENTKKL